MLDRAIKLHQAGQIDQAQKIYLEILNNEPDNFEVLQLAAILAAQKKDYSLAKKFFTKALSINNDSATLHSNIGNVYRHLKDTENAILHYKKALKIDPKNFVAQNNLGIVYYQQNNFQNAIKQFSSAIDLNSAYLDAYFNRGLSYIKTHCTEKALNDFNAILVFEPKHTEANYQIALLYQTQEQYDKAIKHYLNVLRNNPNHGLAHINMGVILKIKNKNIAAIKHCKKALVLDPNNFEAYYNLGIIYLEQNNPEIALKYFLHLAQVSQDFNVFYNLAVTYLNLGRMQDAINYFGLALNINPDDLATHVNLGAIYLKLENYNLATKHYEIILKIDPKNQEAKYILAAIKSDSSFDAAPEKYIKNLFDQYAPTFDKHLNALNYNAPQILFSAVTTNLNIQPNSLNILDLGCGTGLCGEKFRHLAKKLIGLDLSAKMLLQAKQKNIYDELQLVNINDNFNDISGVDLILAADTLVYIGDLNNIFTLVKKALAGSGYFAFTVEDTDQYPYILQTSARFAHSLKYISEITEKNNFTIAYSKKSELRKNRNISILGYIYILKLSEQNLII